MTDPAQDQIAFVTELQKKYHQLWIFGVDQSLPAFNELVSLKEGKTEQDLKAAIYGLICGTFSLGYKHGVEDQANYEKK